MTTPRNAVFLSHASEDTAAAERICRALRAGGIEVWFDQNELRGGDAWDHHIRKQIHDCALFIAVVSAHSNARNEGYFRREWRLAVDRTHDMADDSAFLVPVVIDDTNEATARVPEAFRAVQWTHLPAGDTPPAFTERVAQLLASLDAGAAPTALKQGPATTTAHHASATPPAQSPVPRHRVPLAWLAAFAVAGVVAAGFVALRWHSRTAQAMGVRAAAPAAAAVPGSATPTGAAIPQKSVAVLPFVDMSEKHDQEYFADGMAEEIIERLSRVSELHVPGRASSFYFKGKSTRLADIARELGVVNIVEGSVRKSGDHLRIGAQLVRAEDGYTVWSQSFDRKLDDVFKIQDEIAAAVAAALQISLSGGPLTRERGGTQNLEAYQLYLQALSNENENTRGSIKTARSQLERALQLDPGFGLAWYWLSQIWVITTDFGDISPGEGYERGRRFATRAIAVSPGLADPHAVLAYVYRTYDWNWPAATVELQRALALDAGNADAQMTAGQLAQTLGRHDEAERLLRASLERDPLSSYGVFNLGNAQYLAGHYTQAEAAFRRVLAIAPNFVWTRPWLAKTLLAEGKPQAALDALRPTFNDDFALLYSPEILLANGRKAEAEAAAQRLASEQGAASAFYVAQFYAYAGDKDRAMLWLERAYDQKDGGLVDIVGEPLLKNLWGDPRYQAFMRKMKLPEP